MLDRRAPWPAPSDWLSVALLRLSILALILLLGSAPVHAATIALVRPANPAPEVNEALFRLYGELLSVGLEVTMVELPATDLGTAEGRAWLDAMVAERAADAVVAVVAEAPVTVEVDVIGKGTRRAAVSRVAVEPGTDNPSGRLAIRALEVLRGSFVEIDLAARRRGLPAAEPPAATETVAQARAPAASDDRFAVEAGAAALTSLDGVGAAFLPLLRLGWSARPGTLLQIVVAGPGSRPSVGTAAGSARVSQEYGLLGASRRFRLASGWQPFVGLSVGALRTAVDGQAVSPKQGHAAAEWAFLAEASAGLAVRLVGRYYLALAAHAQLAAPYVAIHFDDAVVATSGRPNLLSTLTVGAWL
jgi:hypothetical protein